MRTMLLFVVALLTAVAEPIPLQMKQGRPVVPGVYVDGAGPFTFLLDTGAQSNAISEKAAARMQRRPAFAVELVSSQGVARRGRS